MQNIKLVSGFSELKTLLIQTYKIERDRDLVRLHFSITLTRLFMHDYDNHQNSILICTDIPAKEIPPDVLTPNAEAVVLDALKKPDPVSHLNVGFQLHGTFSSRFF